jgi:hypothetical protein
MVLLLVHPVPVPIEVKVEIAIAVGSIPFRHSSTCITLPIRSWCLRNQQMHPNRPFSIRAETYGTIDMIEIEIEAMRMRMARMRITRRSPELPFQMENEILPISIVSISVWIRPPLLRRNSLRMHRSKSNNNNNKRHLHITLPLDLLESRTIPLDTIPTIPTIRTRLIPTNTNTEMVVLPNFHWFHRRIILNRRLLLQLPVPWTLHHLNNLLNPLQQ